MTRAAVSRSRTIICEQDGAYHVGRHIQVANCQNPRDWRATSPSVAKGEPTEHTCNYQTQCKACVEEERLKDSKCRDENFGKNEMRNTSYEFRRQAALERLDRDWRMR